MNNKSQHAFVDQFYIFIVNWCMGRNPNTLNEAHYDCNQNLHQQTEKQKREGCTNTYIYIANTRWGINIQPCIKVQFEEHHLEHSRNREGERRRRQSSKGSNIVFTPQSLAI